ncbi:MAG: L-histidine N(alpha)-methyltransferase [Bdellovibrionales bacterium]
MANFSSLQTWDLSTPKFDAETQEFYDGVVDMFFRFREGHLGRFCFSSALSPDDKVRGDEHWTKFIATTKFYYPYHDQIEIIRQSAPQIGQAVADAKTFIDLGTGSINSFERKVLPILRAANFEKIIFVDLCNTFSNLATARLKQEKIQLSTSTFIGNFFSELPAPSDKAAINLFGITLGNLVVDLPRETPEQVLAKAMKHFTAPLAKHGGYFVFDYDTNEDEQSIHAGYEHPSYHAMEMTVLERVKRDLPTKNFNPDDFEHKTVWYPQWRLLAQELFTKKDVRFDLGPHDIWLPKGASFRTGSSFKYPDEMIERTARQAGFDEFRVFRTPNSTMRVAVAAIHTPRHSL